MADDAPVRPGAAPTLSLQIEELSLHGFERIDRHEVASAIERELARLLRGPAAQEGLRARAQTSGETRAHRVDAGSFIVPHNATPDAVGVQVAQAIHHCLVGGAASVGDDRKQQPRARPPAIGSGA